MYNVPVATNKSLVNLKSLLALMSIGESAGVWFAANGAGASCVGHAGRDTIVEETFVNIGLLLKQSPVVRAKRHPSISLRVLWPHPPQVQGARTCPALLQTRLIAAVQELELEQPEDGTAAPLRSEQLYNVLVMLWRKRTLPPAQ